MGWSVPIKWVVAFITINEINGFMHISYGMALIFCLRLRAKRSKPEIGICAVANMSSDKKRNSPIYNRITRTS